MLYRVAHLVFGIVYRVIYRRQVYGRELLPQQGPLIICANHISWQDPLSVGTALPLNYRIKFMAKEELFRNPVAGFFLRKVGAFPVDRQSADYGAVRRSFKILAEGGVVGLFPEGTRSKSGQLQKVEQGAALIAGRSGAPVLPVLVVGSYRVGQPLRIIIGPVFRIPKLEYGCRGERKAQLEEGSRIIQNNLQALCSVASDE